MARGMSVAEQRAEVAKDLGMAIEDVEETPAAPDPDYEGDNATDWDDDAAAVTEEAAQPAEAEPVAEPAPATEPPPGMVPTTALQAEREATRALRDRVAQLEGMFQALAQNQKPAEPEAPAEDPRPDPSEDLDGFLAWVARREEARTEQTKQIQAQQRQHDAETAITQQITMAEHQFAMQTPDYNQAIAHLLQERAKDLSESGLVEPAQAHHIAFQEAVAVARGAVGRHVDPAATLYAMAKRRGYETPSAAPMVAPTAQAQAQPAAQSAQAAPAAARPSPEALAEGKIGGAGAGGAAGGNRLQKILAATDAEAAVAEAGGVAEVRELLKRMG